MTQSQRLGLRVPGMSTGQSVLLMPLKAGRFRQCDQNRDKFRRQLQRSEFRQT